MKYIVEKKKIAMEIKKALRMKKMSQSKLAKELGITRSSVSMTLNNLEVGKAITLNTLLKYSKVLEISFTITAK
ncbi:MAG: helix-turn-helix transcriptional regulator [Psychrilyobacter sp.]|uniref:helix-turn-helix domain-containing protein n=1 Tax=Psychrilyobacter sp. TaxID=2586924 RepID=UPI003C70A763